MNHIQYTPYVSIAHYGIDYIPYSALCDSDNTSAAYDRLNPTAPLALAELADKHYCPECESVYRQHYIIIQLQKEINENDN